MSATGVSRLDVRRATSSSLRGARRALVLALLSVSVLVGAIGIREPLPTSPAALDATGEQVVTTLPSVRVPDRPIQPPAAVDERPATLTRTAAPGRLAVPASRVALGDIPARALVAYQRAQSVINAADSSCRMPWELLAAVGRVESNHGRFGGSALDANGVDRPAVLGPRLDGRGGTTRITDTDGGQYDGDTRFDRAVGPMQFIPSTWTVVGVDGDGDGTRNPQDIDDAALAAAVYLCAGGGDLSTLGGQRAAVHRYNHSSAYVDLVLGVMHAYQQGAAMTPAGFLAAPSLVPGVVVDPGTLPTPPTPTGPSTDQTVPGGAGGQAFGHDPGGTSQDHQAAIGQDHPGHPAGQPTPPTDVPSDPPTTPTGEPTDTPTDPAPTPTDPTPTWPTPTDPTPTDPTPTDPTPTDPTPTDPTPTPTDPTPTPTDPTPVDLTTLDAAQLDALDAAWTSCADAGVDVTDAEAMVTCIGDAFASALAIDPQAVTVDADLLAAWVAAQIGG